MSDVSQAQLPAVQKPLERAASQVALMRDKFAVALPPHIPVDRFMRVALTAIQNNPDLLAADRASLLISCTRAATDGLLPDGRDGALVVYKTKEGDNWVKKVQWMPMVAGLLKKVRNSGQIATITARVVYAGDKFRYWIDDGGEHIEYEPGENPNTNQPRRVFAVAKSKDGDVWVEVLTMADIDKIRGASKAKFGPWIDWLEEMMKKSALRRLSKRLPSSTDIEGAFQREEQAYAAAPPAITAQAPPPPPPPAAAHDPSTGEVHDTVWEETGERPATAEDFAAG